MTTTLSRAPAGPPAQPTGTATVLLSSEAADPDRSRWVVEVTLAALLLAGLVGFHRVFTGTAWIGPVIGSALGVQAVCLLTRRWVRSPLAAGCIDLLSVGLLTAWTVVPRSTLYGLPLRGTWRVVRHSLAGVDDRMNVATVPAHPVTSFLLLAAAGAGIVALAGSWTAFRLGRTLGATLPSLTVFVVCCTLGTHAGRSGAVVLEVVAIAAFLLVAQLAEQSHGAWLAGRTTRSRSGTIRGALPGIVIAAVVALAVVPSLAGSDGHGPLGWRTNGEDSPRIVISPLVSLATRLLHQSSTTVFTVRTSVASYWRLTSLDYFDGTQWNARDTYQGFDTELPGVVAPPRGTRTVRQQFAIHSLESVWLPLAFDPEAVTGAGKVSYDPRSGSLLTPKPTSDHLDYTVTSLEYLRTLSGRNLRADPVLTRSPTLAPYLQLPTSIPRSVRELADRIVRDKRTEYAKAIALQDYFYGPQFTYSLHPPTDGAGSTALTNFLFQTQTGYCQQFAGAFAVLARAVGLPTRLAIGFTAGQPTGGGYKVTDADAHTWPEVWFPRDGWVPFEPTKGGPGNGFAIPEASAYTGNTAAPNRGITASNRTRTRISFAPARDPKSAGGASRAAATRSRFDAGPGGAGLGSGAGLILAPPVAPPQVRHRHGGGAWAVLGILVGVWALLMASNYVGRRLRWARRRRRAFARSDPAGPYRPAAVASIWEEVAERLAWHGIRRRAAETPHQFAERVRLQRRADAEAPLGSHLRRLADLLTAADYAAGPVSSTDVEEADRHAGQIASVLARGRSRSEQWALRLDPRRAWSPRTVDPSRTIWLDVTLG